LTVDFKIFNNFSTIKRYKTVLALPFFGNFDQLSSLMVGGSATCTD
jgi:hypothetical protein